MNTPHKYAEILHAIAEGKSVQYFDGETWYDLSSTEALVRVSYGDGEYRIKPATININCHEVPEPVREPLKTGDAYFIPALTGYFISMCWTNVMTDMQYLKAGVIHLTKEAANTHAKALLSFTSKESA